MSYRGYPKYIVQWQTDYDNESITPQQAAIEAMREIRAGGLHVTVHDVDTHREWWIGFREHEFEVIETVESK